MPIAFMPNTRLITDCTEFVIECPYSLVTQAATFLYYKNRNKVKVLIGIIPSVAIIFISPTYEGSISDKKLIKQIGLLDKLEIGNKIMADKGFNIQDLLVPLGVNLNMPPFLWSNSQVSSGDHNMLNNLIRPITLSTCFHNFAIFFAHKHLHQFVLLCGIPSMK